MVCDVVRDRDECASWRSACSSRRAVNDARKVRSSCSDFRWGLGKSVVETVAFKYEKRTLTSSHSILSFSFSSRSSFSRSASHRRSFSSLSIIESFSRSFFSSSFLVVVSDANWRSSEACASCEVNACVRCWRFAVECCGSVRKFE